MAWWDAGRLRKNDGTGNIAKGEEIWRQEPGGMPLIEEYHAKTSAAKDAYDYAAVWWDAMAKQYQGIWRADFNSGGCTPFTVRKGDGARSEMTGEFWNFIWREVFHLTTPTSFTQILEQAPAGRRVKSRCHDSRDETHKIGRRRGHACPFDLAQP